MTPRTVTILLFMAIISVAAAVYGVSSRVNYQDAHYQGQRVFPTLLDNAESVKEMTVIQNGTSLTFVRDADRWTLRDSGNYPVHTKLVTKLVFTLSNMEFLEQKTDKPERYSSLDLGDPSKEGSKSKQVILKDASGNVMADLIVGRANGFLPESTTGGMYVRRPGETQTWLVRGLTDIGNEPRSWLVREIVDIKPERVSHVDVTQPDGEKLIVTPKSGEAGAFVFANMPEGMVLKSEYAPRNIAAVLNSFVLNDVRRSADVDLDPAQAYVADYLTTDGIKVVLRVWYKDKQPYMTVEAAYVGDKPDSDAAKQAAAIAERTRGWTYIIPEYQYEQLAKKMSEVTEKPKPAS
ncbi:MAG: DUF4340 domain-containing protein [Rhodospirillales bacterium]